MDGLIYLDHAATTPVHPLVRQAMMLYHTEYYGNPETLYRAGVAANEAVEGARRKVAALINCDPAEARKPTTGPSREPHTHGKKRANTSSPVQLSIMPCWGRVIFWKSAVSTLHACQWTRAAW